jgi:hypothetical protein
MIGRASCNIDKIDIALVEHIRELPEHPAVRKHFCDAIAPFLDDIARAYNFKEGGMISKNRKMIFEHRTPETHKGDSKWWSLVFAFHFFTISVIAARNSDTSLNCR